MHIALRFWYNEVAWHHIRLSGRTALDPDSYLGSFVIHTFIFGAALRWLIRKVHIYIVALMQ